MEIEDSKFKLPPSLTPPKEMDCEQWHDILQAFKMKTLSGLDPNDPFVSKLNKVSYCKDDCTFCLTGYDPVSANSPYLKTCAGPEQMRRINFLPISPRCIPYDKNGMFDKFGNLTGLKH